MPIKIARAFTDAFREFPDYQFLFRIDDEAVSPISAAANVDLLTWMPQSDMLG